MDRSILVRAPAKLNLALSVGPPRPDGLHPICSWMTTIDLYDEISVVRLDDDRASRYAILWHRDARRRSEIDWPLPSDLSVRAHRELERRFGRPLPVQVKVEKRVPIGAGLGGGSSDAAATLHAVNSLFDLGLSAEAVASVAGPLGSDIPFFALGGGSAIVSGLGEVIEPQNALPAFDAVVVFPPFGCATAAVYRAYDESGPTPLESARVRALAEAAHAEGGRLAPGGLFNDLAAAAMRVAPDLASHIRDIGRLAGAPVHVSGSGSSIFVVCDDRLHSEALAGAVEKQLALPALSVRSVPRNLFERPHPRLNPL